MLMLATSQTLTSLEEKLSTRSLNGAIAYFQTNGFLTDLDKKRSIFYHMYILKTQLDTAKVKEATCSHDIILADMQYVTKLPKDRCLAIFVHASHKLSPEKVRQDLEDIFQSFCSTEPILVTGYLAQVDGLRWK